MTRRVASLILAGFLGQLAACASRHSGDRDQVSKGVSFEKGAIVLAGSALTGGPGSLLAAMSGKVPNFRVRRRSSECPEITLRGDATFQGISNPAVYVDGTRSTDTCILETLRTDDVERVEVYPQGFTTRPGYGTHAPGLILVFMRSN